MNRCTVIFLVYCYNLLCSFGFSQNTEVFNFKSVLNQECTMKRHYVSSTLESYWKDNIDSLTSQDPSAEWTVGCKKVLEYEKNVHEWMQYWKLREKWISHPHLRENAIKSNEFDKETFSYFEIVETCDGKITANTLVPIEPLMGFLRHPFCICFNNGNFEVNKDYMVPLFKHEIYPLEERSERIVQKYLFDLGASLYDTGAGGASQQWFVETYTNRGIVFDRILAWEVSQHAPKDIFERIPDNVIGKTSYYNVPAETGLTAKGNPLRILLEITHPDDFIVMKIDIDNDPVEWEFIKQILTNPAISSRIDELFFEHHVDKSPMDFHGWGTQPKLMNLTQSYQVFHDLRKLGIRAHSWV